MTLSAAADIVFSLRWENQYLLRMGNLTPVPFCCPTNELDETFLFETHKKPVPVDMIILRSVVCYRLGIAD